MKRFLIFALITFLIGCSQKQTPVALKDISSYKLLAEHNQYRSSGGRNSLEINYDLEDYAQDHADWMVKTKRFKHSNLGVSGWNRVGENIAWGQKDEVAVTKMWMNSPGHKANIMNSKYTHVGFGFSSSSDGRVYWCAVFGG